MVDKKGEWGFRSGADTQLAGWSRDIRVAAYCLAWAICFTGAMQVIKSGLVTGSPIAWVVAALPSVAAVWMLVVYTRYLREMDELERLIQLQAMGWGFGGGFFAICGYLLFEPLGAPAVEGARLAAIMPVLFAIGLLAGRWRYR